MKGILISIIMCMILSPAFADNNIAGAGAAEYSSGPDYTGFLSLEKNVFKNFYDGDLYGLYDSIEKLVLTYPDRPESILYCYDLIRMSDIYGPDRVRRTLEELIRFVEKSDSLPEKNMYLLILRLELEKHLYSRNSIEAGEYSKRFFPVRHWTITGPYDKYGPYDLDYPFMPELTSSFETSAESKNILVSEPDGSLLPGRYLYPARGVAYSSATIKPEGPVKIRIYSESTYKVFINGKETIKNSKNGTFRKCRVLRVWNTGEITLMIKSLIEEGSSARVLLTDDNDSVIEAETRAGGKSFSAFEYQEVMDYPFQYFLGEVSDNPAEAYFWMALYFDELRSPEAFKYYRKSLDISDEPVRRYLYGNCLINQSGDDPESSLYLEGWKTIDTLAEKYSLLIPAQYMKFRKLLKSKSFLRAYYTGKQLAAAGAKYLPFRADYADLLRYLGCEKEFLDEAGSILSAFPFSAETYNLLAMYYKEGNITESINCCKKSLRTEFSAETLSRLIDIYRNQGAYSDLTGLIKEYRREDKFAREMIDAIIDLGGYKEAKSLIFKEMVKCPDPYYNLKLGLISYLEESDPGMYWDKFSQISPSSFSAGDFIKYVKTGRIEDAFKSYRESDISGKIIPWLLSGRDDVSSEILYRSYMFVLNRDGGSRVFCEDVIYLNDEKAADRWGEYKVPFKGRIQPVRVRVYYEDGSCNDSYKIHSLNGESYITLSSLKEKSIAHISYCLNNSVTESGNSMFFFIPFIEIQNFNEVLDNFSLKVFAPSDMPVNFYFSSDAEISSEKSGETTVYSASLKNLGKVRREDFSGSTLNSLPYFTFSTMNNLDDFTRWYSGLIEISHGPVTADIRERLSAEDAAGAVRKVYAYIAEEIDISGGTMFFPDRAADTLFKKRGTAEDRAVLAMSMLSELGVRSYLAFARSSDLPDTGTLVSPYRFSDILLYVPIDSGSGIWLDFSSRYRPCGTVGDGLAGTDAVIIIGNGYEIKRIAETAGGGTISRFEMDIDENGNAAFDFMVEFQGRNARFREEFSDRNYNEEMINYYFGDMVSSISIDDYEILNLEERDSPFILRAKGTCFGIASAGRNRLIFQPVFRESRIHRYIRYDSRVFPLLIGSPINERQEYIYRLPRIYDSFTIDKKYKLENKFGRVEIEIKKDKDSSVLSVKREVSVDKTNISADEYGEFLDFCLKLKAFEQENIIVQ